MSRAYDPNLDNVYVNRDGAIRWSGAAIGLVRRTEGPALGKWRAEIGDPADVDAWPGYRACYARTRNAAVAAVLDGVEAPS